MSENCWKFDDGWVNHVKRTSPTWDAMAIKDIVAGIESMQEQESVHQSQFKQSYYVKHEKKRSDFKKIHELVMGKYDEEIVYSYDSQNGKGLLDFSPASATKQTALEYVVEEFGAEKKDVVYCGDSGNDIFPLTAGFSGVLVKNADDQLVTNVRKAMNRNSNLKVYLAKGNFKNLDGYYASGVIEGADHFGVFD